MRVIAGVHGGRRLVAPKGDATRPTADRVREALFSVLGDVSSLTVLDLFAGSGALGIEALSRGAASAVFVERGRARAGGPARPTSRRSGSTPRSTGATPGRSPATHRGPGTHTIWSSSTPRTATPRASPTNWTSPH